MFEFCNEIKQGKFNYDMGAHMQKQHIVAKLNESEFVKVSPKLTHIIVKSGPNKIDVLDSASLEPL